MGGTLLQTNVQKYIGKHPEMQDYTKFYDATVLVAEIEEADDLPRGYPPSVDDAPSTPASTASLAELPAPVKRIAGILAERRIFRRSRRGKRRGIRKE